MHKNLNQIIKKGYIVGCYMDKLFFLSMFCYLAATVTSILITQAQELDVQTALEYTTDPELLHSSASVLNQNPSTYIIPTFFFTLALGLYCTRRHQHQTQQD